ncbi:DUF2851 family protein [Pseudochryseolinea flava]|uniref:DUF2851 domain-containing protein n=1 Tax=Pseudochryseolinea flava TaxID=2059302 RepID=A0A364Y2Q2_9BACT|nr:DUF2851 family protein [Pseudochryseolinea flava]RAW01060.1 DUF2851 domain-containing protein [Pseudochryseolinea flava]
MSESFLHYIWQCQYFARTDLRTTNGDALTIFHPGVRNTHAGPDFPQARLQIDTMEWVGSVEIHILASQWVDHRHDTDPAYDNVVLHVVWKNDRPVLRSDGSVMPTLELYGRIDETLIANYKILVNSPWLIPCVEQFVQVPPIIKVDMIEKATSIRLERKTQTILEMLKSNNHDWEETCYQLLARNFGFRVNAEPFLMLARTVPLKILLKHADKLLQIEAFLFGHAGFLDDMKGNDDYVNRLIREYELLFNKYKVSRARLSKAQWRFLRLRPANFPTIRLAQFCVLIHTHRQLFSKLITATSANQLVELFSLQQSPYWKEHYHFMKKGKGEMPSMGLESIYMIIINTVVPLMVAYGKQRDDQEMIDRAFMMLQEMPVESNTIIRQWRKFGMSAVTGFDSQGLIEMHDHFCVKHRCLDCSIGAYILKP